ncbi:MULTISPECIES: biotin transporter BioY [Brevibacterium]|uniref:biotin transporter BioY n=1 Tax=Brevibacterium TaxID=1696 RepID=UPI000C76CC1C|nr:MULTISPECIES: biotin transporter BioY [Brevibacterium]QCP05068.1 biotin transporter BioY [Brevibacterium sp. CS2]
MPDTVTTPDPAATRGTARRGWRAVDLALVAVFAALVAVFAALPPIPVGGAGVPITLQTLALALCGLCLGPLRGFAAAALYVVLGLVGLPIFSGFSGGLGVLAGPSAGYIIAFPFFALGCGLVARFALARLRGPKLWLVLSLGALVVSFLVVHPLGILGMAVNLEVGLAEAVVFDMPFWPGDVVKNLVAGALAATVHRAFPQLLETGRRAPRSSGQR